MPVFCVLVVISFLAPKADSFEWNTFLLIGVTNVDGKSDEKCFLAKELLQQVIRNNRS